VTVSICYLPMPMYPLSLRPKPQILSSTPQTRASAVLSALSRSISGSLLPTGDSQALAAIPGRRRDIRDGRHGHLILPRGGEALSFIHSRCVGSGWCCVSMCGCHTHRALFRFSLTSVLRAGDSQALAARPGRRRNICLNRFRSKRGQLQRFHEL